MLLILHVIFRVLHHCARFFRLVGCQDLLEETPSRQSARRDSGPLSPTNETRTLDRKLRIRSNSKHEFRFDSGGMLM